MRRLILVAVLAAFAAGCGGDAKFEPKELTEEQKRKVKEDDDRITQEESGGKGYGEKKKAGKK